MMSIFDSIYWLLFLLIAVFWASLWLKNRTGLSLINPTLITAVVMISYLLWSGTPYAQFEQASQYITFWLQPAVVCLAIPLYVQWQKIKAQWFAILISQLVGCLVAIISGVWFVRLLGGSDEAALSVIAKSVTTPIAIELTQKVGGIVGIGAGAVMVAGVTGQIVGLAVFACFGLKNPMSQSVAMGAASHALGIAEIMPKGQRYVAYGTVGLIVNGILTAFIAPWLAPWLV